MRVLEGGFLFIVNMSLTAAYAALVIILFRGLFLKKLPKIFSYSLWGIILFRLLSPVSFGSAFSFFNLLKPQAHEGAAVARYLLPNPTRLPLPLTVTTGSGLEVEQAARAATTTLLPEAAGTAVASAGSVAGAGLLQILPSIAALIWVLGVAALIVHSIATYIRVTTPVRTATLFQGPAVDEAMLKIGLRQKVNVYASDGISSPFVAGFPLPRVYIPAGCSGKDLPYLLSHELVHVKRLDYLIRPLSYLLVILHWFNPFMWLSFNLMSKDMEMSCDEKVMGILGSNNRQDYSHTLLYLATRERVLLPGSSLAFGESHVKSRIKNVLGLKKPKFYLVAAACLVMGVLGFTLLSNPDSFNMAESFTPLSIEMEISGEMHLIEFQEEEIGYISGLLEYDTWQKANRKHGLSTTTYLTGEEGKVIGLYENVEGYTYIQLYQGFGRRDNIFYRAPGYVFATLRENLFWEYTDSTRSWPWLDNFVLNVLQPSQYEVRYTGLETVLYHDNQKVELLIYNDWGFSKDNLRAEILEIAIADRSEQGKEVYLPEDLLGYYFYLNLDRDATFQKYLLGIRWIEDGEQKKLYSDLFVLDKDTLGGFTILQSYVSDFDPRVGGALHLLPEIVNYTVRLVDDYIIYQDIDLFWKAQDVRTGEIYTSSVQATPDAQVVKNYYDVGEHIYILRYLGDGLAMAFEKAGKDFLVLPYPDTVPAYPLKNIDTASFKNLPGENILLELSEEEISNLKLAFNGSFHAIREFVQYPPIPLQYPPDLVLEVNTGYKERINIYEIAGKFYVSYVEFLEDSEFVITNYILLSPELQVFFDTSRYKFPDR